LADVLQFAPATVQPLPTVLYPVGHLSTKMTPKVTY
jgi:hypothetical protein